MRVNDASPVGAGGNEPIMPQRDESLPYKQAQVRLQFAKPPFVLMGIGTEHLNGHGCCRHIYTSSSDRTLHINLSSIA